MDINEENLLKAVDSYRRAARENDFNAAAAARETFEKCLKVIDEAQAQDLKSSSIINS
jgi:hypothetical protein